jgi:hypothetical protein
LLFRIAGFSVRALGLGFAGRPRRAFDFSVTPHGPRHYLMRDAGLRSDMGSISEIQWAHTTLMHLIYTVQMNGLLGDNLSECLVQMGKAAVVLESVIQESLVYARRRKTD